MGDYTHFVEKVLVAYRQMVPIKVLLESCKGWQEETGGAWTCLECQEQIFHKVIEDAHCQKYPPLRSYTTRFLRHYIDEIELVNEEVLEDILEKYVSLIHVQEEGPNSCYKSYTLPNSKIVSIQVSTKYNEGAA